MFPDVHDLTIELVPHAEAYPRAEWTGDDIRGLGEVGAAQARGLALALAGQLDAVYSSPAQRCRQTVEPLAHAAGLPIVDLADLRESGGFSEPASWTGGVYAPMGDVIAGAWLAGRAVRALNTIVAQHPSGRVVASSHGDLIPVLLAFVAEAFHRPLPDIVGRGDWYRLRFRADSLTMAGCHRERDVSR